MKRPIHIYHLNSNEVHPLQIIHKNKQSLLKNHMNNNPVGFCKVLQFHCSRQEKYHTIPQSLIVVKLVKRLQLQIKKSL